MDALELICQRYNVDPTQRSPIEIEMSRESGLPDLWRELGFTVGAEIGVAQGIYSEHLLRRVPGLMLYCVDPWQAYTRYHTEVGQAKLDTEHAEAQARLCGLNAVIVRRPSMEAARLLNPGVLDFVYIDGNHEFEHVVNDIIAWSKIVRKGGIVSGHDYKNEKANHRLPFHVVQAVNAYTDAYKINPWFILRGDESASWMWVKP